ncbi:MAG TPA: hypothetical protein VN522_08860 [Solirubrobacterales bacterium]|nr:hypothetical protein [Solirubrobacterales bacterium]
MRPSRRLGLLAAACVAIVSLFSVASAQAGEFKVKPSFTVEPSNNQAAAHPDVHIQFELETEPSGEPAGGTPRDVAIALPKGLVGAPNAVPTCPMENVINFELGCSADSMVGEVDALTYFNGSDILFHVPVYAVNPYPGEPAAFAFRAIYTTRIDTAVRSDGDFGITSGSTNLTEALQVLGVDMTLWGVPHDHNGGTFARKAFWTNPTQCTESLQSLIHVVSWQSASITADASRPFSTMVGCEELEFAPKLKARPTTNVADAPSGLDVDLEIPQYQDPEGLGTAHLRKAEVTLPEGLVINPSSANGLGACTPAQIGLTTPVGDRQARFDLGEPSCPAASRLGSVEVETPILDDPPLKGSIFLASPHQNPFGSLLSLYLVFSGHGLRFKLAGEVRPNPQTGRLTATFDENPQLPFSHLKLKFDAGAYAPLRTPMSCGRYSTTSVMTPWAAPAIGAATPSDTYEIVQGPNAAACGAAAAKAPSFEAGSSAPLAGKYSPFVVNLRRADGSPQFSAVTVTPPPGLVAKLANTAMCSDTALTVAAGKSGAAEQASPSCPAGSQIGNVYAAAGAGPAPFNAPGKAYLAGPYKGAPLSMAIVTPAVAGPFDLGTIVVRVALNINPATAQITAVTDPIPTILQGIPLDIRSVSVRLDAPNFTLNPSSCDPTVVSGSLLSTAGSSSALQNRFQLAECGQLRLKPSLVLSLNGPTKRGQFPTLKAVLKPRAGDANLDEAVVALPRSEFIEQGHIRTVCTRVQFAADQCPAASVYGKVTVDTPLLSSPLTGPVYLRSSNNKLPDMVLDLHGPASQPIRIEADGRIDSVNGGIRTTFTSVPDVPFTKMTLQLGSGKKSLLVNSTDICVGKHQAELSYTAHNGLTYSTKTPLKAQCGGKKGKKSKGAKGTGKRKKSKAKGKDAH